ncbi:type II toxin-antitoxin system Phd/YefM family antitoxin [Marinobacter sp.]|uniref:type II toxin-antitoxin system Phd/YefM family antitoxin n=1 Tax=Marinobacter sp. TaxID=50741 RepID=UPI0035C78670
MQTINAHDVRKKLDNMLDAVGRGDEFVILHCGKPVARLTRAMPDTVIFPDRSELRASLPPVRESASQAILGLRDDERY